MTKQVTKPQRPNFYPPSPPGPAPRAASLTFEPCTQFPGGHNESNEGAILPCLNAQRGPHSRYASDCLQSEVP